MLTFVNTRFCSARAPQGFGRVTMINALNINSTVGIFFEDWVEISEGETIDYDVSLYEDADTDKVGLVWCGFDPMRSW